MLSSPTLRVMIPTSRRRQPFSGSTVLRVFAAKSLKLKDGAVFRVHVLGSPHIISHVETPTGGTIVRSFLGYRDQSSDFRLLLLQKQGESEKIFHGRIIAKSRMPCLDVRLSQSSCSGLAVDLCQLFVSAKANSCEPLLSNKLVVHSCCADFYESH